MLYQLQHSLCFLYDVPLARIKTMTWLLHRICSTKGTQVQKSRPDSAALTIGAGLPPDGIGCRLLSY